MGGSVYICRILVIYASMLSRVFRDHFSLTYSDTDIHVANLNITAQSVVMSRYFTLYSPTPNLLFLNQMEML